jgi:hypothetical protein
MDSDGNKIEIGLRVQLSMIEILCYSSWNTVGFADAGFQAGVR